jgi:hypothetical protein
MRTKRIFNLRSLAHELQGHLCGGVRLGMTWLVTLGIILEIGEQDLALEEVVVRLCINAGVQTIVLKLKYSGIKKLFGLQIYLLNNSLGEKNELLVNHDFERIYSLYS